MNISISTNSAAAQHKIEEEIIAEEIRHAQQQQQASDKKRFQGRKNSDLAADMVADFDDEYLDDGFENQKTEEDPIVDEVEEEDALRMIDEEIMNTAVAKQDARKLKDLISKIDGTLPRSESREAIAGKESAEKSASSLGSSASGSFKSSKPIDQQTKFSSSSKVVVSKYSKSTSKQNLHESNSIFAGRRTP